MDDQEDNKQDQKADPFADLHPTDYVEELLDKKGNHMRKEVHEGKGYKTIEITSDQNLSGDDIQNLIGDMIMQTMMQDMANMQRQMKQFKSTPTLPVLPVLTESLF